MPGDYEILDRRGLTDEQQAKAWDLYERTGNMTEVARQLGVGYHMVRGYLVKDQMRLEAVRACRAEEVASRWEAPEKAAARLSTKCLAMVEDLITHIEECERDGLEYTHLQSPNTGKFLTPIGARQWIITGRVLDTVQKLGFVGAKIAEGMRLLNEKNAAAVASTRDPSTMSDDELHQLVHELQSAGLELPFGLKQWADAHRRSLPARDLPH